MTQGSATIMPALRYRDAPAAIAWLCTAFGFARHVVYPGADGLIEHAELTFGNGMVMLGSVRDSTFDYNLRQPDQAGGVTQTIYVVVADPDAHHAQSKATGAEIVMELRDESYGRLYSCRDPEGHLWSFGNYDPWQTPPAPS